MAEGVKRYIEATDRLAQRSSSNNRMDELPLPTSATGGLYERSMSSSGRLTTAMMMIIRQ